MSKREEDLSQVRFWVGCLVYHKLTGRFGVVVSCCNAFCKIVYAVDGDDNQTPVTVLKIDLERGYCCTQCQGLKREHELAPRHASLCTECVKHQPPKANQRARRKIDPVAPLIW